MSTRSWTLSIEDREKLIKAAFQGSVILLSCYFPPTFPLGQRRKGTTAVTNFPVGAALLAADGTIIKGANIENASYGATICAERTAFVKAVSEGTRKFIGLAVTSNVKSAISPCGICRQFIREFCANDMPILLVPGDYPQVGELKSGTDGVVETTLNELLPMSFGPEDLENPKMTL